MTEQLPLVSVCCITYNHKSYISEAIESFLNQKTNFRFEILIYDDCSTDGTREVLKYYEATFPSKIRVFYSHENQYQKGVRLLNLRYNLPRSRGEFVATCDGDDFWCDKYKLQKQVDFLTKNPEAVSCFHDFESLICGERKRSESYLELRNQEQRIMNQKEFLLSHVQFATLMFRNSVNFPQFGQTINGDVFVLAVLSEQGKSGYLNFVGSVYRHHDEGVFRQMDKVEQLTSSIRSRKLILPEVKPATKGILSKRISEQYEKLVYEGLRGLNPKLVFTSVFGIVYYKLLYSFY